MLKFINFIIFLFFLNVFANAEIVKNIQINGNKKISDETIKIYGDIKVNENYNEKKLNDILNNLYKTNFFEDVDIKLSNNILTINLKEFHTINQIIILGEKSKRRNEQIKKIISLKEKQSFIKSNLSNDIELIKNYYSSSGFNSTEIQAKVKNFEDSGYGELPICIAKTQYSFSTDPSLKGAPTGHALPIREIRLSSGAEFIVVVCGAIMTMPGLPRVPAADSIKLNKNGEIEGLF